MDYQIIHPDQYGVLKMSLAPITTPTRVTGIQKLVQICYINLLKAPAGDLSSPDKGGGLLSMVGQNNIDPENIQDFYSDVVSRIRLVEEQMIEDQLEMDLSPDEKLQTMNLLSLEVDEADPTSYYANIEIINEEEDISSASIPISASSLDQEG